MTTSSLVGATAFSAETALSLPFHVRAAKSTADYEALCKLREAAYSRHRYTDQLKQRLGSIDQADRDATLLIAVSKSSGEVLGTMRVSSSRRGPTPILPGMPLDEVGSDSFVYVDRLAVKKGEHSAAVTFALMKGLLLITQSENAEWLLGAALRALVPKYQMVGLRELVCDSPQFYAPGLHSEPYTALGERASLLRHNMTQTAARLVPFFFEQVHADIDARFSEGEG